MSRREPIKVLVVEDSPVVRDLISYILTTDPDIRVIAAAATGEKAIEAAARLKPDLITMDVNLPGIDGYEATRRIMETCPAPIIIVSASYDPQDLGKTFRMVEAGALAILPPPLGIGHPEYRVRAAELIRTVKLMSEIKVVRRWAKAAASAPNRSEKDFEKHRGRGPGGLDRRPFGSEKNSGGPGRRFSGAGAHGAAYVAGLRYRAGRMARAIHRLSGAGGPTPGTDSARTRLSGPRRLSYGNRPVRPDRTQHARRRLTACVPPLPRFSRSVAERYGPHAVGILLTGMGADGAAELALMKEKGAITIAQDKESSVVHGIPGEAIKLGAAMYVLAPEQIAELLKTLTSPNWSQRNIRG